MNSSFTVLAAGIAMAMASTAASAALDDAGALELMKKAGCSACHTVDKKLVGPSYKDVAAKRKGTADAAKMLQDKVRAGGKGEYGQIPMPPNPEAKIGDADLQELVLWVLKQ